MAAFIPSRRDPAVNEVALARVREDKQREAGDGFDGTWVAHPDLVPVAREEFRAALAGRAHQLERRRDEVRVSARDLLDVRVAGGAATETGLRTNVGVGVQYLASWLSGVGAAAINNLMEDAATAEISRSQVWQWVHHGVALAEGGRVSRELVRARLAEEAERLRGALGLAAYERGRFAEAAQIFDEVALSERFVEFLTLPAYERIDL
jgi:malate synthase